MARAATIFGLLVLFGAGALTYSFADVPDPEDKAKVENPAKKLRKKLAAPITLEKGIDANTAFKDAIEFLVDRFEVPIIVDTAAFTADHKEVAKGDEDTSQYSVEDAPIRLPRMIGVKLGTVLRLLTAQVNGTYQVRSDYIEITTVPRTQPSEWTGEKRRLATKIDAEFDKRPLDEALRELADLSGINVVLDVRLGDIAKSPVTATLTSVPVDTAVRLLADMAELKSVALDNVLYVTNKGNADELQAELDKAKIKTAPPAPMPKKVKESAKPAAKTGNKPAPVPAKKP